MEKTLTCEERIRRAEEIYNRRKSQYEGVRVHTSNVNSKGKANYSLFKRMILQILICLFIYLILYLIKNSNYIFSEEVINKTREFLSYDINFGSLYNYAVEYYNNNIKDWIENTLNNKQNEENTNSVNEIQKENIQENVQENIQQNVQENVQENVGGIGRWNR